MATITVPDALMSRLAPEAALKGITIDELVVQYLDAWAWPLPPNPEEQRRARAEMLERARARADRYPPGHRVSIDRADYYPEHADDES